MLSLTLGGGVAQNVSRSKCTSSVEVIVFSMCVLLYFVLDNVTVYISCTMPCSASRGVPNHTKRNETERN